MMQRFQLLHGGDYNPEQWLDRPDILAQDIALMKKALVNTVTLGVFSWSALEPQEGVFALDWLADIIHSLYDNGISTILATPSAARPAWMAQICRRHRPLCSARWPHCRMPTRQRRAASTPRTTLPAALPWRFMHTAQAAHTIWQAALTLRFIAHFTATQRRRPV